MPQSTVPTGDMTHFCSGVRRGQKVAELVSENCCEFWLPRMRTSAGF